MTSGRIPSGSAPAGRPEDHPAPAGTREAHAGGQSDTVVRLIALERSVRAILLVGVGAILLTHLKADWGRAITDVARALGLDSRHNAISHLVNRVGSLSLTRRVEYGAIAAGYGLLEAVEAYGLWRRRPWGEYLTIVSTALLLIPEVDELIKRPTVLKAAGFVVNVAVVIYLIFRVRRRRAREAR
ncbi:MAG: DUF2127 domain-containing protein [Solirubrobacterales bacterium]|nr:DUF2127 domain-containing protein [Solirubrobacterales bacterium]